jgi:hypothetical protein
VLERFIEQGLDDNHRDLRIAFGEPTYHSREELR